MTGTMYEVFFIQKTKYLEAHTQNAYLLSKYIKNRKGANKMCDKVFCRLTFLQLFFLFSVTICAPEKRRKQKLCLSCMLPPPNRLLALCIVFTSFYIVSHCICRESVC